MMIFGETPRFYKNKVKIFIADNKKLVIAFVVWSAILLAL
jgi:hypothetical protein